MLVKRLLAVAAVPLLLATALTTPLASAASDVTSQTVTQKAAPSKTLFGASVSTANQSFSEGLRKADQRFGGMGMVRVFYPGTPRSWPGQAGSTNRPTVVSFKMHPREVNAGKHDAAVRKWFQSAPKGRDIWWSYFHEPEDDIARGSFTSAQYRSAWKRLSGLAQRVDNPKLHATLILMQWSLDPRSRRDWRNYYAGGDSIDVLAFDTYVPTSTSTYTDPVTMLKRIVAVSKATSKPFGISELGSLKKKTDKDGAGRAKWLRGYAAEARRNGALFVSYWEGIGRAGDYRLHDAKSQAAWREAVNH